MSKIKSIVKDIGDILGKTSNSFLDDKVFKLSGSLAYSTVFSMGPLLIVIISLCSIFLGRQAVEGKIYFELGQFLGQGNAMQIQEIIKQTALSEKNTVAIVVGSIILFFGATSIFGEIQDSINDIWGIKPKPRISWLKYLQNRFLSFSVIIGLGFLLLVSLIITASVNTVGHRIAAIFPDAYIHIFYIANEVISFFVVTLIFAVIFKVLPDAKIIWKDVIIGALVTAVLFMAGKFGISYYIGQGSIATAFGAAGSLIVLLLWVYYSSLILYFGAEFTKSYAIKYGSDILPAEYAVTKKQVEVEGNGKSIQEVENAVPDTIKLKDRQ